MKNKGKKKILLMCTQRPGYGGASTESYKMISLFRKHGIETIGLFMVSRSESTTGSNWHDPDNIGGVLGVAPFMLKLPDAIKDQIVKFDPDILIGKNYMAPLTLRESFKGHKNIVYITAGVNFSGSISNYMALSKENGVFSPKSFLPQEIKSLRVASKIICHSQPILDIISGVFPQHNRKIYDKAILTSSILAADPKLNTKAFGERQIDVMFAASHWDRKVKNLNMVLEIIKKLPEKTRICIAGEAVPHKGGIVEGKRVFIPGLLGYNEFLGVLSRTKVLVIPSTLDACPNTVAEGINLGCNIVCSDNCGNSNLCVSEFVIKKAEDFNSDKFVELTVKAIAKYVSHKLIDPDDIYQELTIPLGL